MRCLTLLIPALLIAGTASAQKIVVEKGEWTISTDIYLTGEVDGQILDEPVESESVTECWLQDDEVELDESMLAIDGCTTVRGDRTDYSMDLQLSCVMEGIPMDGSVFMSTNAARDMMAGRFLLESRDPVIKVRSEGIIMAHRTGTCAAAN